MPEKDKDPYIMIHMTTRSLENILTTVETTVPDQPSVPMKPTAMALAREDALFYPM
jgi:hypothetical protein